MFASRHFLVFLLLLGCIANAFGARMTLRWKGSAKANPTDAAKSRSAKGSQRRNLNHNDYASYQYASASSQYSSGCSSGGKAGKGKGGKSGSRYGSRRGLNSITSPSDVVIQRELGNCDELIAPVPAPAPTPKPAEIKEEIKIEIVVEEITATEASEATETTEEPPSNDEPDWTFEISNEDDDGI